ncbi:MAG: site-specific DNA-methyltransferase, partial [Pyrinomonadaceae bacterium MAG19_C2-C3]|nr:site-specific DNA-methyltransferase [Pyrinomonadaceae bacterium MAG19_C2-C3]
MNTTILHGDCASLLDAAMLIQAGVASRFDLTFLDPPFNQNKDYEQHDDDLPHDEYWLWMEDVCRKIYDLTTQGGALYFMHREKNAEFVLRALREANWTLQNLIVWKKKTSAVPGTYRFGK